MGDHCDHHKTVAISDKKLTLKELVSVARHHATVSLSADAIAHINDSRHAVDRMVADGEIVYGITTGFGSLASEAISPEDAHELQHNLIVSHACGIGAPLPKETVRAMMLLRAKSLSQGRSGIRLVVIETLLEMLNKKVTPLVPEKGSLGSSGDLCPLSHMVLPILGLGKAYFEDEALPIDGKEAMRRAGINIIGSLEAKEGLALNNGTQCMTAVGALAVYDALHLLEAAEKVAALSLEALNGREDAFDPRIHALRGQEGQIISAARMLKNTANSTFLNSTKPDRNDPEKPFRVQDAYALRCIPQVHGASRDTIAYVRQVVEKEINAVTDNPLIFPIGQWDDAEAISGGNFHGQPIALAMDFLGIALSELANISERRLERMVNGSLSNGLPAYLTADEKKAGLHSGFMIVQYAAASLVSENKVLSHPASVDSIPSSNNQEDHVSMGTIAARKAAEILENVRQVIAMELLTAAQAIDLRLIKTDWKTKPKPQWLGGTPTRLGDVTQVVYNKVREKVEPMMLDRVVEPDIATVAELLRCEAFTGEVEV